MIGFPTGEVICHLFAAGMAEGTSANTNFWVSPFSSQPMSCRVTAEEALEGWEGAYGWMQGALGTRSAKPVNERSKGRELANRSASLLQQPLSNEMRRSISKPY
jgi:hypothetical protein